MELKALFEALNGAFERKNLDICFLEIRVKNLEKENAELKAKNEALENDVKMYQENEQVKGVTADEQF